MKVLYCDDSGKRYSNGNCIVLEAHIKPGCPKDSYEYVAIKTKDYLRLIKKRQPGIDDANKHK